MIDVKTAQSLIEEQISVGGVIKVPLIEAYYMVLAENIYAVRSYPPFNRATKDGIAVLAKYCERGRFYKKEGYAKAGSSIKSLLNEQNCIEIATGAALPIGADAIIPYESLEEAEDGYRQRDSGVESGENVHTLGDDAVKGDLLLEKGEIIGPTEVAALATNGFSSVWVVKKPKVAIVTTGDELLPLDAKLENHRLYRSNDLMLQAVFRGRHFSDVDLFHLLDNKEQIEQEVKRILEQYNGVILTGGVSKGRHDFVPEVLEDLGVKKVFHGIRQRPGKPMWFGRAQKGTLVFGLPGNPVSALTCSIRYVLPTLLKISGFSSQDLKPTTVFLGKSLEFAPEMTYYAPVQRGRSNQVFPHLHNGSGDFFSLLQSDGFIELPAGKKLFRAGQEYPYYSWGL